jgi:hypothetical protein
MRLLLPMLALLIAAAPDRGQVRGNFSWKLDDENAPADPSRATLGGFGVLMVVTSEYDAFWKAWEGSSPPQVSTTEEVTRDQPVHAMLIFSGCRAGPDGDCNVTVQLRVTAPNGSQYGDILEGTVWNGPPAPEYNLQLAESSLGFILEPGDPLGTYTLKASVTDHVADITLKVEQAVTAKAGGD